MSLFAGENDSGKSTLLEAIADYRGFNPEGGSRDYHGAVFAEHPDLPEGAADRRRC